MASVHPPHTQLQHLTVDRLRTAIIEGELALRQWLRQRQLAEEFSLSQMPVREALRELAAEGLVEHIPYREMRVVGFSADDVADLYARRSLLESMAARAAATCTTPDDLNTLRQLHAQMAAHHDIQDLAAYRTLRRMWAAFPHHVGEQLRLHCYCFAAQGDADDLGGHEGILRRAIPSRPSI